MIAGLENPDAGTISLGGKDVYNETTNVPSENRNLGMVFQEYALFPHLTVEQNLAFGIELKDKKERHCDSFRSFRGCRGGRCNKSIQTPTKIKQ